MIASFSITVLPVFAYNEPQIGVKKGDWIEYNITMTGPPLDSARNLTWFRNEILDVQGNSFKTNMTSRSVNGTVLSSLWDFNLNDGQVCGWMIIPANLSKGEQFFDVAKGANITIEGQDQKIVTGVTRAITHATDPGRLYKEWDKATGMFTQTQDNEGNYTIYGHAIATNIWSPQILGLDQPVFYAIIVVAVVVVVAVVLVLVSAQRKRILNKAKVY